MLIVGSKALKYRYPNLERKVKDTDVIASKKECDRLIEILKPTKVVSNEYIVTLIGIEKWDIFDTNNVEILLSDNSISLKKYLEYDEECPSNSIMLYINYASSEVLFSLKKSHIHFPRNFVKHIADYNFLFKQHKGIDNLKDITLINFKETEDRIGKLRTPSLNKSVNSFFDQSTNFVKSYFVHDEMHLAVAHYDRPLYERMQKDTNLALCDKGLWEKFSHEDKCKCVLEEAMVIALERKILPMIYGGGSYFSSKEAIMWSLMRICTTLCSGWFRAFATNNYSEICGYINTNYVEEFLDKVDKNQIKRIC